MTAHATLSPSSAERWLSCTASVDATAHVESTTSVYAEEGTTAHRLAAAWAGGELGMIDIATYETECAQVHHLCDARGWDYDDMRRAAQGWAEILLDLNSRGFAMTWLEQRVNPRVPGVWGTADATIVTANTLHVIDLKYGQGVSVEAYNNPQLMLYGLGSYEMVREVAPDIHEVHLAIYQPRNGGLKEWTLPLRELLAWRESVRTIVAGIDAGAVAYRPGEDTCRWCPIKETCRARIEWATAADFDDGPLPTYSDDELPGLIERAMEAQRWANELLAHAKQLAEAGARIDGWKLVASRAMRKIVDPERAMAILHEAGYEDLIRTSPETITTLEKALGPDRLTELLGECIVKSSFGTVLVPEDDRREAIAAHDFTDER